MATHAEFLNFKKYCPWDLSISSVVRKCCQCSAGKSYNANRLSRSFFNVSVAFGYFAV
jgi:hypothetical protein